MTNTDTSVKRDPTKAIQKQQSERDSARRWMWLSILMSIGIIGWAFSLPFQEMNSQPIDDVVQATNVSHEGDGDSQLSRTNLEQHVEDALEMDRLLMQMQREKDEKYRSRSLPGRHEAEAYRISQRERLVADIEKLKDALPHTIQWQTRKELEAMLDAPQ